MRSDQLFHQFLNSNEDPASLIQYPEDLTEDYAYQENQYLPTLREQVAVWGG